MLPSNIGRWQRELQELNPDNQLTLFSSILSKDLIPSLVMPKIKNLRPHKCEKLLEKEDWAFINREGSHATFTKVIDDKNVYCQVIWNNKTVHWKNAAIMIKKSGIPVERWIKECK